MIEKIGWVMLNNTNSSNYIDKSSKEYSIYVCETRSIPKLSDGLKDGQRKALWLMRNKQSEMKTAALTGTLLAEELYYHGDVSASDTISKLAAPFLNNIPLLEGRGAFGSKLYPDAFGAARYTYVKRSKAAQDILYTDIELVPMMDNYDGSNQSPSTFLPLIPTVLLNGVSGIAVGWSTEILSYGCRDIIDNCISALNNKKLSKMIPKFSGYNVSVEQVPETENSWIVKGKVIIKDSSTCEIVEIPRDIKIDKFREFLDKLEDEDKINSYTDKSSDNISIIVQFRRGSLKDVTEEQLIDFFKLRSRVTERIVVLNWDGKSIKSYDSPENVIKDFIEWRLQWFSVRYNRLREIAINNLNYEYALKNCFDNQFPAMLPEFQNKKEAMMFVEAITTGMNIDDTQIEKIVSMPGYKWTKDSERENKEAIINLKKEISEYDKLLGDSSLLRKVYVDELTTLKEKYLNC